MSENRIDFLKNEINREIKEVVRLSVAVHIKSNHVEMLEKELEREMHKQKQK